MAQGKQAKILTRHQEHAVLDYVSHTRNAVRDRVLFVLSIKAGLRAKEIAGLTWGMVTDGEGQVAECLALPDQATKGTSGRTIYLHPALRDALCALARSLPAHLRTPERPVIYSMRGRGLSAASVTEWFLRLYANLGMVGCSSHSGRRTFITRAAQAVSAVQGSLRDVQQLAGHANLAMTQRYIEGDTDAKRKLVMRI